MLKPHPLVLVLVFEYYVVKINLLLIMLKIYYVENENWVALRDLLEIKISWPCGSLSFNACFYDKKILLLIEYDCNNDKYFIIIIINIWINLIK